MKIGQEKRERKQRDLTGEKGRRTNKPVDSPNKSLHQLGKKCGEVRMFENESDIFLRSGELQASQYIAVITHSSPKLLSDVDVMDLVVFRTRKKVFAGLPEVFSRITRSVGKTLHKFAMVQTIFVHKGNKMRRFCKETWEWEPEKIKK
jgi:hypothetical protein